MTRPHLDQEYADYMQAHHFGLALYQPISKDEFQPGTCGYFDQLGSWNPIAKLNSPEDLAKAGFTPLREMLQQAPVDDSISWGPKVSDHTRAIKIGLSAETPGAAITGIPVSIGAMYSFSTDASAGAVLLTTPPVVHERFYHESPFKTWIKENAERIIKTRPEVRDYGLWIVKSTYATKKCAINVWRQGGKSLQVGFKAKVVGVGECGPSGEWYEDHREGGWNRFEAKGDDMKVVFFGGLKFRFTRFTRSENLKVASGRSALSFRGEDPYKKLTPERITTIPDPDGDEDSSYMIDCEEHLGKCAEPSPDEHDSW